MPRKAKTRNALGQGSKIITRQDGRKAAFVTIGYRDGKQIKKWVYGKTEREVVQKLNKLASSASSAVLPSVEVLNLKTWLQRYSDALQHDRSMSTIAKYQSYMKHINNDLGDLSLNRLDAIKLRAFFAGMSERGLSPSTRQHAYDFVKAALEDAVHLDLLEKNPMRSVARPKGGKVRDTGVWSIEEVRQLLKASSGYGVEFVLRICVTLGLRIGEALALKWSDLKGDALHVQRTLNHFRKEGLFRPCKSESERVLFLDEGTINAFKAQHEKQNATRAKALEAGLWQESHNLIFTSEVGTPFIPRNVARALDAIIKRAGVTRYSSHAMRKTYASLAALHIPPKEIQERLGHKDVRMTMSIYTHVMQFRKRSAALSLEQLLTPNDTLDGGQA
jgi:integrase